MQSLVVEGMDSLWLLLWTGALSASLSVALLLTWAAYYHCSRSEVPRGVCQPHLLRFLHVLLVFLFGTDHLLWKLGLSRQFAFLRFVSDILGSLAFRDPKLTIKNVTIKDLPVRVYQPKAPQSLRRGIIHIHGGAGIAGSIACYEKVSRYFANETDSVVFTIEYGLGPENPYTLPFQQCLDVTIHLLEHAKDYGVDPARLIVCGDSFGGLLTAATCEAVGKRRDLPKLRGQILLYAVLQSVKHNLPSYLENSITPLLFRIQIFRFALQYLKKNVLMIDLFLEGAHVPEDMRLKYNKYLSADNIPEEFRKREAKVAPPASCFGNLYTLLEMLADSKLSPLLADDEAIQQLPETFILTCQYDVLRDEGILYKRRLEENDVPVSWCHLVDGFHGALFFINFGPFHFSCTKTGIDQVVDFIRRL